MEFQQWYNSLPKVTRVYLIAVFATTLSITYFKFLNVFYYFYLDYDKILELQVYLSNIDMEACYSIHNNSKVFIQFCFLFTYDV
jgi:hypothetical protein